MKFRLVSLLALFIPAAIFAQEFRGTISGSVTDPTGAAVSAAKVTVTEEHTGTKIPTVSDSAGQYAATFLLPGDYDIVVASPGFKEALRKGVHVGAGDHPVIDFRLAIGDVSQSVEVIADASLINTENATVGQAVTTKEVEELPINGRTPMIAAGPPDGSSPAPTPKPVNCSSTVRPTPPGTAAWLSARLRMPCRKSASRLSIPTPPSAIRPAARSTRSPGAAPIPSTARLGSSISPTLSPPMISSSTEPAPRGPSPTSISTASPPGDRFMSPT